MPEERFNNGPAEPSGLWAPEVSVTTVSWNSGSGLEYASLLASGTASGLVRIDDVKGRWFRGNVPYGGDIMKIRCEAGEEGSASESESN